MDAILYGTGRLGNILLDHYKYDETYNVIFFCDSDKNKWGNKIEGIEIKSPQFVIDYEKNNECIIIIASEYIVEIVEGLVSLGLDIEKANIAYASICNNFLTRFRNIRELTETNDTVADNKPKNTGGKLKKMLFVQMKEDPRTFKIAESVKSRGINVDHAFTRQYNPYNNDGSPKNTYGKIIRITDIKEFMDFVNNSDYDIIHCSNEPDDLAALLTHSNKKLVYDCHDMMTLRDGYNITDSDFVNEYIAHKYSDGLLHTTETYRHYAVKKYGLQNKLSYSLNNYTTGKIAPKIYKDKLSSIDNEIHCVYEGGIIGDSNPSHHRYIEPLLLRIANSGVHVHFHGSTEGCEEYLCALESKSPYLHNEGFLTYDCLMDELTQYDIGLGTFNVNEKTYDNMSASDSHKFFDYLLAGLPIATVNLLYLSNFITTYKCGVTLDFNADIKEQLQKAMSIKISKTFLKDNRLLMEQHIDGLIDFYERVMAVD